MRFEKLTTKLQEALAGAQSAALGHDHQYIEPQHLLLALRQARERGLPVRLAGHALEQVAEEIRRHHAGPAGRGLHGGGDGLTLDLTVSGARRGQITYRHNTSTDAMTLAGSYDGKEISTPRTLP